MISDTLRQVSEIAARRRGMDRVYDGEGQDRNANRIEEGVFMRSSTCFSILVKEAEGAGGPGTWVPDKVDEELKGTPVRIGGHSERGKKIRAAYLRRAERETYLRGMRLQRSKAWNYLLTNRRLSEDDRVTAETFAGLDNNYDPWTRFMLVMAPTDKEIIDLAMKHGFTEMAIGIFSGMGMRRVRKVIKQGDGLSDWLKRAIWLMGVMKTMPKKLNDPLFLISWGRVHGGEFMEACGVDPVKARREAWHADPNYSDGGLGI